MHDKHAQLESGKADIMATITTDTLIFIFLLSLGVRCEQFPGSSNDSWAVMTVNSEGNDTPSCWNNTVPCRTIGYALTKDNLNWTTVILSTEVHQLNSIIHLQFISHFRLVAGSWNETSSSVFEGPEGLALINCTERDSGFYFGNSDNIVLSHTTLKHCGAVFLSSNVDGNITYNVSTALHMRECQDVKLLFVEIRNSFGMCAVFYDVVGGVMFKNVTFAENSLVKLHDGPGASSGGGIYIEFLPVCDSKKNRTLPNTGSVYTFEYCKFENLTAEYTNSLVSASNCQQFISYGRGGGISYIVRGNTKNHTIDISNSIFFHNKALWGSGIFAEFDDKTGGNAIEVSGTKFINNTATLAGGGMRIGINSNRANGNNIISLNRVDFLHNEAQVGGGFSEYRPENAGKRGEKVTMQSCNFLSNYASRASAIDIALVYVHLENCMIDGNTFGHSKDTENGEGAIYAFGSEIELHSGNVLKNNNFTALILEQSHAVFFGSVHFKGNTGHNGGAIGIYGEAYLRVMSGALLHFFNNSASKKGGAIYVELPMSSQIPMKSTELRMRRCFFSFGNTTYDAVDADKSNTTTYFAGNSAYEASGQNIYATTINMCRRNNESRFNNSAFKWKVFNYGGDSPSKTVVTNPVIMRNINRNEWFAHPGLSFSPRVALYDENFNNVFGNLRVSVISRERNVHISGSQLFIVKDRIPKLSILGPRHSRFSAKIETVEGQPVVQTLKNLLLGPCPPGYYFYEKNQMCYCNSHLAGTRYGVTHCHSDLKVSILRGRWGDPKGNGEQFAMHYCPKNYCNSPKNSSIDHIFEPQAQCAENRQWNSTLCGKCKIGYSVSFGDEKCAKCKNNFGIFWLLLLLLVLTAFVLVVLLVNVDTYSTSLNAFLYSFQIIPLCTLGNDTLDPFINIVIGLINFSGSGDLNIGVCIWKNMDDLEKMFLNYLVPFYLIICTIAIGMISYRLDNNCRFNRRTTFRAFVFISVVAYSDFTRVTFNLLNPVKVRNHTMLFIAGDVKFFGRHHLPYAVIALLVLVFVVFLFPLILMFSHVITAKSSFVKLKGIFDTYREPFRPVAIFDKFCAFYFITRVILLIIYTYVPHGTAQDTLFAIICILILVFFIYFKPYTSESMNLYDTLLLTNIAVMAAINVGLNGLDNRMELQATAHALSYFPLGCLLLKMCLWIRERARADKEKGNARRNASPFPPRAEDDTGYVEFQD